MAAAVAGLPAGQGHSITSSPAAARAASRASSMRARPADGPGRRAARGPRPGGAGAKPGSSSSHALDDPGDGAGHGPDGVEGRRQRPAPPPASTRPRVVLSPTTPQQAAGIRIEPPVSLPKATSASPAPTATAEPLDDPPGHQPGVERVDRCPEPRVDPRHPERQLVQVGLADDRRPCRRPRRPGCRPGRRRRAGAAAALAAMTREPLVVGMPAMSMRSLTASSGGREPAAGGSKRVMKVAIAGSLAQPGAGSSQTGVTGPVFSPWCIEHVFDRCGVGYENPPVPWRELEAALSGRRTRPLPVRRATAGTARPGRTSGPPTARPVDLGRRPGERALRRAALPLQLQLPRRGLPPRGAGRGGGPPGAGGPGHHRPRRHVRGGPFRRGGPGGGDADGVRRRAVPRADPPAKRGGRPRGHPPADPGPGPRRLHPAVPGPLGGPSVRPGKGAARRWTSRPSPPSGPGRVPDLGAVR